MHRVITVSFTSYFVLLTALASLPGPFGWSNRVDPWVLAMPFMVFWQLLIAALFAIGLAAWYLVDARSGDVDVDVEAAVRDSVPADSSGNGTEVDE